MLADVIKMRKDAVELSIIIEISTIMWYNKRKNISPFWDTRMEDTFDQM